MMRASNGSMIYIPGPITAPSQFQVMVNVASAVIVASKLMQMGYQVFCPHTHSDMLHEVNPMPWDYWMGLDLRILRICDALVCAPGWEESKGACVEVQEALRLGIPVYTSFESFVAGTEYIPLPHQDNQDTARAVKDGSMELGSQDSNCRAKTEAVDCQPLG